MRATLKLIYLVLIIACSQKSHAQLVVNLQLPPMALTIKSQLWTMALINTSGSALRLKADITLTDQTNNVLVMTASTGELLLAPGTRQMQAVDFMPLVYNVTSSAYNIDNNPNGFLPVGHFTVCYQFTKITGDNVEFLTDECENIEIEPLSPPILVYPEEEAVLEMTRPVFSWLPPAPLNLFSNLSYDFRLVEVLTTQSPADAVQQNIALYAVSNIAIQSIPYAEGLPALDTGRLYAWQVTAKNNNSFIAKSDVWTFRIGHFSEQEEILNSGQSYAKLKQDGSINYFLCTGQLKFQYDNYFNEDSIQVSIIDMADPQTVISLDSNYIRLEPGQNLIKLDLTEHPGFTNNHLYHLVLLNSRQEKWTGKFLFKRNDN